MRSYAGLILTCAAASIVLAILVHDFVFPAKLDDMEPALRAELELEALEAKREIFVLLIVGLLAWIRGGKSND